MVCKLVFVDVVGVVVVGGGGDGGDGKAKRNYTNGQRPDPTAMKAEAEHTNGFVGTLTNGFVAAGVVGPLSLCVKRSLHGTLSLPLSLAGRSRVPWRGGGGWGQDKTRQDKTRQDKTRQDKIRQDKTRQDKTRQDKTRQDKTR